MAYERDDRYPSALAMADAIEHAVRPAPAGRVAEWASAIVGDRLREREARVVAVEMLAASSPSKTAMESATGSPIGTVTESPTETRVTPRRRRVSAGALALALVLVALAVVAFEIAAWRWRSATSAPIARPEAAPSGLVSAQVRVQATDAPPPPSVDPAKPGAAASAAPRAAATLRAPAVRRASPASKPKGCETPFRVDESGVRIPKPECF
jgi:serine/threonine-protein kinase